MKADGLNEPIVSDGTVVTYYYKKKAASEEKPALAIDKASISLESSIITDVKSSTKATMLNIQLIIMIYGSWV